MKSKSNKHASTRRASKESSYELVARHIAERKPISLSHAQVADSSTFGQRAADAVARFGGSWAFIGLFALVLVCWVVLNSIILGHANGQPFDPYPYILLNLFLSMLASIQAPVILMSQNRQGEKDRIEAKNDYEVNLKAELEIMALHEKVDVLKAKQWEELITIQSEQIRLLTQLCSERSAAARA